MKPRLRYAAVLLMVGAAVAPAASASGEPGGASPPRILSTVQGDRLKAILGRYDAAALTAAEARAIKLALRKAGLRDGAALDQALTDAGFSRKRLEALDPQASTPLPQSSAPGLPTGRTLPRRQ